MSEWKKFAVVVDGEVAEILSFSSEAAHQIAVYSSNPVIIPVTEDKLLQPDLISLGCIWDGEKFQQPSFWINQ